MTERAKALMADYRANWAFWSERERTNFVRRCQRLADRIDPRTATGLPVMILDNLQGWTGRNIWRGR